MRQRILLYTLFLGLSARWCEAKVIKVPQDYPTIQLAVGGAAAGDKIMVGPGGTWVGATIDRSVILIGEGNPVINDGLTLPTPPDASSPKVGFYLDGSSTNLGGPDGTTIRGFTFEGTGAGTGANLAFAVFGRNVDQVLVTQNIVKGTVQAITNISGSGWIIDHNQIVNQETRACFGGLGILVKSDSARSADNTITFNDITGLGGTVQSVCTGTAFAVAGIAVISADNTVVKNNKLGFNETVSGVPVGVGIVVDNLDCGGGCFGGVSTGAYIVNNDERATNGYGVFVRQDTSYDNTTGLVLRGNFGYNLVGATATFVSNRSVK